MSAKQPMQPVYKDADNVVRFRENAIIRYIVDHAADIVHPGAPAIDPKTGLGYHKGRLDLSKLATLDFPQEDREQFAQLMGYSIAGYHELSYVSDESCEEASVLAEQIVPGAGGCRDAGCPIHGGSFIGEQDQVNDHTRDRLEAILGPIPDDDALVDKVRALDEMLTRYLRDSLERAEQDELRDQIALDRREAIQAAQSQTMPRCTCGLVFTTREDAVVHAKQTLHAVRGLFYAGTPSSDEPGTPSSEES